MKELTGMTPKEVAEQMMEWFPWLKEPMPYQPRIRSKEEKESEFQWKDWRSDMQWWVEQNRLDAMRRGD